MWEIFPDSASSKQGKGCHCKNGYKLQNNINVWHVLAHPLWLCTADRRLSHSVAWSECCNTSWSTNTEQTSSNQESILYVSVEIPHRTLLLAKYLTEVYNAPDTSRDISSNLSIHHTSLDLTRPHRVFRVRIPNGSTFETVWPNWQWDIKDGNCKIITTPNWNCWQHNYKFPAAMPIFSESGFIRWSIWWVITYKVRWGTEVRWVLWGILTDDTHM